MPGRSSDAGVSSVPGTCANRGLGGSQTGGGCHRQRHRGDDDPPQNLCFSHDETRWTLCLLFRFKESPLAVNQLQLSFFPPLVQEGTCQNRTAAAVEEFHDGLSDAIPHHLLRFDRSNSFLRPSTLKMTKPSSPWQMYTILIQNGRPCNTITKPSFPLYPLPPCSPSPATLPTFPTMP